MFIIGRGHTVYLDNRTIEYNGQIYNALNRAVIFVDGKQVAKLNERERGMSPCIGQNFSMSLTVSRTKDSDEENILISIRLPLHMDGIIISLPALLAGLPEEAYLSEFIITPVEPKTTDQPVNPDELTLPDEWGDL
jgi:hypothetical protein